MNASSPKPYITGSGVPLLRAYVYMPPDTWELVNAASIASRMSASQFLASLVDAYANSFEEPNDTIPATRN